MSSSSSDSHRRHKKRKHRRRHRSRDSTAIAAVDSRRIPNRVAVIDKTTTTDASQAALFAASSLTEPTVAGEQRPPSLPGHVADRSGEEQSTSTTPAAQLADDNSPGAWIRDELEVPDYNETVYREPDPDSDDGGSEVQELSPTTAKLVEEAFSHSIPNEKRISLKRKQPTPDTPHTKFPKLDPTIQSRLPKPAKDADRCLAKIQTLLLDAAAPLIPTLEAARKGSLTPRDAAETAHLAFKLLGNASANISMERRLKASAHLNAELSTLVEDEDSFKDVAPLLLEEALIKRRKTVWKP